MDMCSDEIKVHACRNVSLWVLASSIKTYAIPDLYTVRWRGKLMQPVLMSTLTLTQFDGLRCVKSREFYGTRNASNCWHPTNVMWFSNDPVTWHNVLSLGDRLQGQSDLIFWRKKWAAFFESTSVFYLQHFTNAPYSFIRRVQDGQWAHYDSKHYTVYADRFIQFEHTYIHTYIHSMNL
jgi:hypothetical protein